MRVFRHVPILALLLAASAVAAVPDPLLIPPAKDAVKASGPRIVKADDKPIPVGGFADLTVEAGKSASVNWRISPAPVQKATALPSGRLIFGGKPGTTYLVTAFVVDFDAKAVTDTESTVTFAGTAPVPPGPGPQPKPQPGPQPGPGPQPNPQPIGVISTFVIVEDTLKAGPWRGDILGSPAVVEWYRQLQGTRSGPIHTLIDVNAPGTSVTAKRFAPLAAGKKLPYVWCLDASGQVVKECEVPIDSPAAFIACFDSGATEERQMGLIIPEDGKLKYGLYSAENPDGWKVFGTTPNTPLIPRERWKPVSLAAYLPSVYDQNGKGQCASSATASTIETVAAMRGTPFPKLSAGDLYSRVNGGRDQGSMLEDNLVEAMKGIAPASKVPYVWNGRRATDAATIAERAKYRITEAYWCRDFDGMGSAIQQGFAIVHGLMWHNNFKPDRDGWLPARGSGGGGGHALLGFSLERRGDVWGIGTRNSWSASWGIGGNCVIPESLFTRQIGGYFAVRVVSDPTAETQSQRITNPFREYALAW